MKTIVVPTDFSSAAENAAHYAAALARHTQAALLLVHIYMIPLTLNDMPLMAVSADELKKNTEEALERFRNQLALAHPGLDIRVESRLGDINSELKELARETDPLLVVMGTHGRTGLADVLFGSNTISAIRHMEHPVLAVPATYPFQSIGTIVLAADLAAVKEPALQHLHTIAGLLKGTLHVVHVQQQDEEPQPPLLQQLQALAPVYHAIRHTDVNQGLQDYIRQVNAGLLIVLPHEHSMLESFFFRMHTKDLVRQAPVPVLCIKA